MLYNEEKQNLAHVVQSLKGGELLMKDGFIQLPLGGSPSGFFSFCPRVINVLYNEGRTIKGEIIMMTNIMGIIGAIYCVSIAVRLGKTIDEMKAEHKMMTEDENNENR